MNMHRHLVIVLGSLALLLIWSSVMLPMTSASAPAVDTKAAIPLLPVDGHWTGTTSRGHPMSFDVSSGGTAWSNFKLKTNFSVGGCSGTIETTVFGPGAITNDQFSYSGSTYSFSGQFTSPTTASGTYAYVNHSIPNCGLFSQSGTWMASGPPGRKPDPPSNLTALALSQMQILLGWDDNSDNEAGFKIEQSLTGTGGWTQIATTPANVTSHAPPGLNCGTTYYYRVLAYNAYGDSDYSNTANATTLACPTITPTPTNTPTGTPTPMAKAYLPYVARQEPSATPTPISTPTATATPASELDGTWSGTTSQGKAISFTIVARSFTRFTTGYQIGGCGGTATTTFGIPQVIIGNTFVIIQPGGSGITIRTDGTFNSDTSASGTLTVTGTPCGNATATWTATKQ